ncbi:hypothetical protein IU459_31870 [Nocardia amamiensis]|uniref:Uncharacterized protein n=1 Tax=Nocardia amamiensis TaxID=404578 RepID=A0ABS0CZV8_9NOCA|nr:hypothetical protein [Nocardia amamiensis]MBF6302106.1 hypothetical protein [Nocardia amamiensis]
MVVASSSEVVSQLIDPATGSPPPRSSCPTLVAVLTPPDQVENVTGWVLTADGQWLTKLLGLALFAQAWVACVLRKDPHLGVARGLAFYQLASATADWVMWLWLADDGIFSNGSAIVVAAITTHYALGFLLVRAIRKASAAGARTPAPAAGVA